MPQVYTQARSLLGYKPRHSSSCLLAGLTLLRALYDILRAVEASHSSCALSRQWARILRVARVRSHVNLETR